MSRSKGWWRLFKRRSSFCIAGWGLCLFDGRVPFAHTLFIHGAALTANVSGALPAAPPTPPAPGQQNRRCAVPSPPFPRFRSVGIRHPAFPDLRPGLLGPSLGLAPSGPPQAAFKSAPGAFVHAGLTWLVNSRSAILMPDPPPQLHDFLFLQTIFIAVSISHTHSDTSVP